MSIDDDVEKQLRSKKIVAKPDQKTYLWSCPISHVPVVVCQSVGIRTRGRTAAKGEVAEGRSVELRLRGQHLSPGMPLKALYSLQP